MTGRIPCKWCLTPFKPEKVGGAEKVFCTAKCRNEAHRAKNAFMTELFNNRWRMVRQWHDSHSQPYTAQPVALEAREILGVGEPEKMLTGAETS